VVAVTFDEFVSFVGFFVAALLVDRVVVAFTLDESMPLVKFFEIGL
jgi:hypothetical protein